MPTSSRSISTTSGPLDVADLVDRLMEKERASMMVPLARRADGISAAIAAYGNLKAALLDYQEAIKGLDPASFGALRANHTNGGAVSGMATAAASLVTTYNALAKTAADLTRPAPSSTPGEKVAAVPLASESAVRNMMARLRGALMAPVEGSGGLIHLASIGIALQKDGMLALDGARFSEMTNRNFGAVSHLFGSRQGVVTKTQKIMDQLLGNDGIVEKKKEGLQASLKIAEGRYAEVSRRLADMRDRITIKYSRLNKAPGRG